ncbi:MAG: transposase [Candidatus Thiothrix singaporensis]|uniref:Transposase n=1 Tax=Candidatus Thiothrix singaporensis TaxID=2799669 RepID=A0A7L6AQQ4_9GAMM|nr:MAG: transposase [Candidatus Thiothrix singaporensis]
MSHTKRKQHYSADFKREAVALVTEQNYSVAEAAAAVGASANNLRRWKQVLSEETSGARLTPDERAELHRLRRENKQLQMEREILKRPAPSLRKKNP